MQPDNQINYLGEKGDNSIKCQRNEQDNNLHILE